MPILQSVAFKSGDGEDFAVPILQSGDGVASVSSSLEDKYVTPVARLLYEIERGRRGGRGRRFMITGSIKNS